MSTVKVSTKRLEGMALVRQADHLEDLTAAENDAGVVMGIDSAIRAAFIHLDALDRRALSNIMPPITPAQYHVLAALAMQPTQNLGGVAARTLRDKSNASGLVGRLMEQGLVDRVRDPVDGRRVMLSLTPAGRDVLTRATQARMAALRRALTPLELTGLTTIAKRLDQLTDLLRAAVAENDK